MNSPIHQKFPVLTTARLSLRKLNAEDRFEIFELRSNPIVNKYLDRPEARDVSDAKDFIQKVNTSVDNHESYYWAITMINDRHLIGTICLWNLRPDAAVTEIGFELNPLFQGRGFMHEALQAVVHFSFGTLKLKTIEAVVLVENAGSIRLLEKNKFNRRNVEEKDPSPECLYYLNK